MAEINPPATKSGLKIACLALLLAGMAVFAFYASTHMVAAGDTWVALACGRHHIEHGVGVAEPFSFNSHKPGPTDEQLAAWPEWTHGIIRKINPTGWVNQNWLTHISFYELTQWFGSEGNPNYNTLVVWKFALYLVTAYVVYAFGRVIGVTPLLAAVASCFAMVIGRTFFDIRPAGWSNLFVPVYLLILALSVYRNIRFIWLLIPLVVLWAGFHGGYIYVYLMMFPFCGLHLLSMASRNRLVKISFSDLKTVIYAAVVSFAAMLIFNPYHLTNLTHTFEISISKHAESWRTVNEWKPAFDFLDKTSQGPNPVGEEEAFGVMCILFIVVLLLWGIGQLLRPRLVFDKKAKPADIDRQYETWPKIDLPMLAIAILTTYMAVESRRFIAIAGSAVCPVIFLLIQQAWQASLYKKTYNNKQSPTWFTIGFFYIIAFALIGWLLLYPMQRYLDTIPIHVAWLGWLLGGTVAGLLGRLGIYNLIDQIFINSQARRNQLIFSFIFGLTCLGCGLFWGREFKTIYLNPWPEDPTYNSIFMRMTASNVKPIDACKFITDNRIAGRVFNYWTEGGAIAFGQKPDPNTGEIPLKLFMDGRAQAAYNHDTFQLWQGIYGGMGCPAVQNAYLARRKLTSSDYQAMADWIGAELKHYDVWVVLMPLGQASTSFMTALRYSENWKTAYYDPYQWMLVDTSDERGKKLVDDILHDKATFPNELAKSLTLCNLIPKQFSPELAPKLEQAAISAFQLRPSPITISELIQAAQVLRKPEPILGQLTLFLDDFQTHRDAYRKQDGYGERLRCAAIAADSLGRNIPGKSKDYGTMAEQYKNEIKDCFEYSMW